MSLHYLVKLEVFIVHILVEFLQKNYIIYSIWTVASVFARFENSW